MINVTSWLDQAADSRPNQIALNTIHGDTSYRELKHQVINFASFLCSLGLVSRDRVIVIVEPSELSVAAILGAIRAGLIVVPIHADTPSDKISFLFKEVSPKITISNLNLHGMNKLHIRMGNYVIYYTFDNTYKTQQGNNPANVGLNQPACIIYTSGSTGKPKGVVVTHDNICFTTNAIQSIILQKHTDRILSYLPLSFDYGLYQIFLALVSKATLILRRPTIFKNDIEKVILEERVTGIPGMRSLFGLLISCNAETINQYKSIRFLTNTGEGLPHSTVHKLMHKFPIADIFLMYGLTECKRVSILPPHRIHDKVNSVGLPLPGTSVRVVDRYNEICPIGKVGELVIEGSHVCSYWGQEEDNDVFFYENDKKCLRTGDLFSQDNDGFLYFHGRKDESFKCNGFRIDPLEIEQVILKHVLQVEDAIAVGHSSKDESKRLILCVVPVRNVEVEKDLYVMIISCCKKYLEPWKIPHDIKFFESFHLSESGKIDRRKLKMDLENGNY